MKELTAKTQLPLWMQWINKSDRYLKSIGISLITLSEESLIANAQQKAELSDWGDESFRAGLRALLLSIQQENNLSLTGRWLMKRHITNLLINRLQIQSTLKQHPEILTVPIRRPLIITGLPRTGTTLLHRLLAQDSQFRWLRLWELLQPCPPPALARAATDPRIRKAQALARQHQKIVSNLAAAHRIGPQLPEEGNQLLEHAFTNFLFNLRAHLPTYETWLRNQDMTGSYRYYRQQLQLLGWQWPGRWLLKAPTHLRDLDALVSAFPDACIVQMHRDPIDVVPSMCSLTAISRRIFSDDLDLAVVGRDVLDMTAYAHEKGRRFRQQYSDVPICDVDYVDLVRSPIATVQRIYNFFGDSLQLETIAQMEKWLAQNPKNKYGAHQYSLEQFGLSHADIQERFTQTR